MMNTVTITEIKPVEALVEFGIELDLDTILVEELEKELASDISNAF